MIKEELKKFPPGCEGGELIERIDIKNIKQYHDNKVDFTIKNYRYRKFYYFEENSYLMWPDLKGRLLDRGLTFKEWFDYHYLNKDESCNIIYPTCPECGELCYFYEDNRPGGKIGYSDRCLCHESNKNKSYISNYEKIKYKISKDDIKWAEKYSIDKYGDKTSGLKEWAYFKNFTMGRNMNYSWHITLYGYDEGLIRYKHKYRNAFHSSYENFVRVNGEELGKIKWKEFKTRMRDIRTLEGNIKLYGEELGTLKYKEKVLKSLPSLSTSNKCVSPISLNLFNELSERISIGSIDSNDIYYGYNEYVFFGTTNYGDIKKMRKPDFLIKSRNIIVEFQGSYWHPRPSNLDDVNELMDNRISDSSINDYHKLKCYRNMGYYVYYIHEEEYKENKDIIIEECIKFITNEEFRNEYTRLIDKILV